MVNRQSFMKVLAKKSTLPQSPEMSVVAASNASPESLQMCICEQKDSTEMLAKSMTGCLYVHVPTAKENLWNMYIELSREFCCCITLKRISSLVLVPSKMVYRWTGASWVFVVFFIDYGFIPWKFHCFYCFVRMHTRTHIHPPVCVII